MQNLGTVNQYHMAYYGAISAVERAELGLRYRAPGFVGSGGFLGTGWYGPASDYTPELLSGVQQGFRWTINSRTHSIPNIGMGNTDSMLSDPNGDSKNYNQLGYTYLETIILSYDNTADTDTYTGITNPVFFSDTEFDGIFRLPPKIFSGFGGGISASLCASFMDGCDPDGDGTYDDIALSWSMEGLYNGNGFKIFPTIAVFYYSGMQVDIYNDNAIRESIINNTGNIRFENTRTPIVNGSNLTKHNVVAADASTIQTMPFSAILSSSMFSGLHLSFGATNLFRTYTGAIYPYLEYQFTFPQEISDRFYTIEGHGRVGEYDVKIVLKKPTAQGTVGGDFTVIF
ncbi:MAG: hypothetical protein WC010_03465 [Candidatus Absconditabacterales bacterium]